MRNDSPSVADSFIDPAMPQRAEQALPRLRQRVGQRPKRLRDGSPGIHNLTVFAVLTANRRVGGRFGGRATKHETSEL